MTGQTKKVSVAASGTVLEAAVERSHIYCTVQLAGSVDHRQLRSIQHKIAVSWNEWENQKLGGFVVFCFQAR